MAGTHQKSERKRDYSSDKGSILLRLLFLSLLTAVVCLKPAFAQWPQAQSAPTIVPVPKKPFKRNVPTHPAEPSEGETEDTKLTLLGQYGDWGAYSASAGGNKICFASAKPSSSDTDPPGRSRSSPSYMFISARPGDKVSREVSVIIGYAFRPKSDATLEVGSASFALATRQDGAWIKNQAEETDLVAAMRVSQSAVLKGESAKGTRSTDRFALKGLTEALDRSEQDCK
jgi:hypothetical protein